MGASSFFSLKGNKMEEMEVGLVTTIQQSKLYFTFHIFKIKLNFYLVAYYLLKQNCK